MMFRRLPRWSPQIAFGYCCCLLVLYLLIQTLANNSQTAESSTRINTHGFRRNLLGDDSDQGGASLDPNQFKREIADMKNSLKALGQRKKQLEQEDEDMEAATKQAKKTTESLETKLRGVSIQLGLMNKRDRSADSSDSSDSSADIDRMLNDFGRVVDVMTEIEKSKVKMATMTSENARYSQNLHDIKSTLVEVHKKTSDNHQLSSELLSSIKNLVEQMESNEMKEVLQSVYDSLEPELRSEYTWLQDNFMKPIAGSEENFSKYGFYISLISASVLGVVLSLVTYIVVRLLRRISLHMKLLVGYVIFAIWFLVLMVYRTVYDLIRGQPSVMSRSSMVRGMSVIAQLFLGAFGCILIIFCVKAVIVCKGDGKSSAVMSLGVFLMTSWSYYHHVWVPSILNARRLMAAASTKFYIIPNWYFLIYTMGLLLCFALTCHAFGIDLRALREGFRTMIKESMKTGNRGFTYGDGKHHSATSVLHAGGVVF